MNVENADLATDHSDTAAQAAGKPVHPFKVTILYNGLSKEFEVRGNETIQQLLDQARQKFGPINNAHLLGLFTQAGVELSDAQTVSEAGLKPGEVLLMRPSTVRGG